MAPRGPCMANQVASAILTRLAVLQTPADAYLSVPLTILRGIAPNWSTVPHPALYLRTIRWGANEPGTAQIHRVAAEYEVLCITEGPPDSGNAEKVLLEMTADVASVLEGDFQLSGVLSSGWMHLVNGYEPYVTGETTAALLAVATVSLSATWEWTPAAP